MIRVAFVAYLSMMAAIGPALCCCNLRHLVAGSDASTCCGKIASKSGSADDHAGHDHAGHNHKHGGHTHHHAKVADSATPPADTNSLPQRHDGEDCPCGRQDDLIAVGPEAANALDLQSHGSLLFAVALPIQVQIFAADEAEIPHVRPALLAGREMLRAYQIMRC